MEINTESTGADSGTHYIWKRGRKISRHGQENTERNGEKKNSIWIIKICKICLRPLDHNIGGKIMKVSRWVERCEGVVSKRFYLWFSGKLSRREGRALSEKWDDMEGMWKLRTTEEQSKRQNSPSHLPSPEKSLIKWLHLLILMEMCNLSIGLTPRNCSKLPLYSNRKE